jgi:hypothetical protein
MLSRAFNFYALAISFRDRSTEPRELPIRRNFRPSGRTGSHFTRAFEPDLGRSTRLVGIQHSDAPLDATGKLHTLIAALHTKLLGYLMVEEKSSVLVLLHSVVGVRIRLETEACGLVARQLAPSQPVGDADPL